jgi:DUF4097 and DUF4098 domain-containing protein YvlB
MKNKIAVFLTIILFAALFFSAKAFSEAREEFHQNYAVKADTEVKVGNVNGNILISTWEKDSVDVHAIKRTRRGHNELDKMKIEVTIGDVMEIKAIKRKYDDSGEDTFFKRVFGSMRLGGPKVTVDFTIKLPETIRLSEARSTNGTVELQETRGDTYAHTTNGNVIVDSSEGYIKAKTTNGNITINGETTVREASTTNGSISASLSAQGTQDTKISTTNGSVKLYLYPDMDADIELKTINGKISAEGISLTLDTMSKNHLIATIGSGGRKILAKTVNGSIRLNKK